ncbi:MAG: hypothetical protein IANPNBLG_00373 [Bryobacteraceae bacterium]|nr:hypothetical protein [Bryobacteraceae bacterium]
MAVQFACREIRRELQPPAAAPRKHGRHPPPHGDNRQGWRCSSHAARSGRNSSVRLPPRGSTDAIRLLTAITVRDGGAVRMPRDPAGTPASRCRPAEARTPSASSRTVTVRDGGEARASQCPAGTPAFACGLSRKHGRHPPPHGDNRQGWRCSSHAAISGRNSSVRLPPRAETPTPSASSRTVAVRDGGEARASQCPARTPERRW